MSESECNDCNEDDADAKHALLPLSHVLVLAEDFLREESFLCSSCGISNVRCSTPCTYAHVSKMHTSIGTNSQRHTTHAK